MRSSGFIIVIAACLIARAGTAAEQTPVPSEPGASVSVTYAQSSRFTDVGNRHFDATKDRSGYLELLTKHLIRRGKQFVPAGQQLAVTITNLDMAGSYDPSRSKPGGLRIVTDVYPPRIDLIFTLTGADGSVVAEGRRELRDIDFMTTTFAYRGDTMRHEKALLDNWLISEFGGLKPR